MQDLGVTQRQVSVALGVTDQSLSNFLNGQRSYSYARFIALLGVLGLTIGFPCESVGKYPPTQLNDAIGEAIRKRDYKVKDIARECAINASGLSSFLSGNRTIGLTHLESLRTHLGLEYVSHGLPKVTSSK